MITPILITFAEALGGGQIQDQSVSPISEHTGDQLRDQFASPPAWSRPHTWWHWIDGNVTKEGITTDLEAMKQAGLGGAHIFNAGSFGGHDSNGNYVTMPKGPIVYNTPEWRALMVHAMREAKRLGLEITVHNCAGWSSSGGPWVKPEDAMKKVVWSTVVVQGPSQYDTTLPQPPTVHDEYHDIAVFALPEVDVPAQPDAHHAYLTSMGDNDGKPFDELKWPVVDRTRLTDVSTHVTGGRLTWSIPEGRWTILRVGWTLTGAQNVASSDSGRGLEVDKLSRESFDRYFDGSLLPLIQDAGPLAGDSFTTVLIDSYETGRQNWTQSMPEEFRKRRGYELLPYLPALCGVGIDDTDTTQRFLFDFRRTIAEMWSEHYAGRFAERLKQHGMQLAVEPYGNGPFNAFTYAEPAGLIMGEYWVGEGTINSSVKLSSSITHVLGRKVVGAEALTATPDRAGWSNHPYQWKPFADRGYINGINRIIYHRFTHQPWPSGVLPGMTMGPWGSHVDRTQTWWHLAPSWHDYLSRCQYLLQSGEFVADVCVCTGEDEPQAYREEMHGVAQVPEGYGFDYCTARVLMGATVKDGRLVLPGGMSYRLLALPASGRMSSQFAAKIRELAAAGATVVGAPPSQTAGLNDPLSAGLDIGSSIRATVADALRDLKLPPDFHSERGGVNAIHRRIGDADAYFVTWFGRQVVETKCFFRIEGRQPELWHPESGVVEKAAMFKRVPGGVELPLRLGPAGSVFVVFRSEAPTADPVVTVEAGVSEAPVESAVKVIRAEYGVIGDMWRSRDVTDLVAEAIATFGEVEATNESMGGDPAVNIVKQLRVIYSDGGKERTVTIPEGETLRIGRARAVPSVSWELKEHDGAFYLHAWQTGLYRVIHDSGASQAIEAEVSRSLELPGPWEVRFPAGWDAPESATFGDLISWTDHQEVGIKYFSGTATYHRQFDVDSALLGEGKRLVLDLGTVREIAEVLVNGKNLGVLWWPPFRLDVTDAVKAGSNELEVRVTNLWVNRLIGDEQLPDDIGWQGVTFSSWPEWLVKGTPRPEPRRKTFTTWRHNRADTPLIPSGLMGPVVLHPVRVYRLSN
ncbi:MAG: hypothetical protein HRF45_03490 [Fimbriimonadia bacterium]